MVRLCQLWSIEGDTVNGKLPGKADKDGYFHVRVDGFSYSWHRIVYAIATGQDPGQLTVDHIDGNPLNNRPSNLRARSHASNIQNVSEPNRTPGRTSKHLGVSYEGFSKNKPWRAVIKANGKRTTIGRFATEQEAADAYLAAKAAEHQGFVAERFDRQVEPKSVSVRKHSTGERNITKRRNRYVVRFGPGGSEFTAYFDSLESAVLARNEYMER
jgi:hypothetical protein